jgi:hypothetical protein
LQLLETERSLLLDAKSDLAPALFCRSRASMFQYLIRYSFVGTILNDKRTREPLRISPAESGICLRSPDENQTDMITEIYPKLFLLRDVEPDARAQFVYVLKHDNGLAVFGTKGDLTAHYDALRTLGKITHVFLGDRHHATEHTARLALHFGVPLSASQTEAAALKAVKVGNILPFRRVEILPGLEAIPTPGHTRGAFSYFWQRDGKKFLFVGDTIVPVHGEWRYWVSPANHGIMRQSMQALAALEADVILSNSFAAAPHAWVELTPQGWIELFAGLDRRLTASVRAPR